MNALLAEHVLGTLFISGCVANQSMSYPRFDAVVLLSAPIDLLLARVTTRTTNPYGKAWPEREQIMSNTAAVEPLLRAGATAEIDTGCRQRRWQTSWSASRAPSTGGTYNRTSDSASSAAPGRCAASHASTSANRRAAARYWGRSRTSAMAAAI
jgi:hypothetical protein